VAVDFPSTWEISHGAVEALRGGGALGTGLWAKLMAWPWGGPWEAGPGEWSWGGPWEAGLGEWTWWEGGEGGGRTQWPPTPLGTSSVKQTWGMAE
jgi:hypothetical protein